MKKAIRPHISPKTASTDGWEFWQAADAKTGEVVSLQELRRRTAAGLAAGQVTAD